MPASGKFLFTQMLTQYMNVSFRMQLTNDVQKIVILDLLPHFRWYPKLQYPLLIGNDTKILVRKIARY